MGAFARFIKWFVGLIGSLVMLAGFLLFFLGLIFNNIVSSIDNFSDITAMSIKHFVADNPEEVHAFVEDYTRQMLGPTDDVFKKENLMMICEHPDLVLIQDDNGGFSESVQMVQSSLKTVCKQDINAMSQKEINALMINTLVDQNIEKILEAVQDTSEVEAALNEVKDVYSGYKNLLFWGAIGMYLLGIFFIFISVSFKWMKGLYHICLQTFIKLITIGLIFIYFLNLTPDKVVSLIQTLKPHFQEQLATNAPPLILKLASAIVLEWFKIAIQPLVLVTFVAAAPFLVGVVLLLIYRHKKTKTAETQEVV